MIDSQAALESALSAIPKQGRQTVRSYILHRLAVTRCLGDNWTEMWPMDVFRASEGIQRKIESFFMMPFRALNTAA